MTSAVISDLTRKLQKNWKKYRSEPAKVPNELCIEVAFMHRFFTSDCIKLCYDGTGQINVSAYCHEESYECHRFIVTGDDTIDGPTGTTLYFYYFGGNGFCTGINYGLIIQDSDENVLYWREVGQNPRTEWLINCLADDLKDEQGKFVFPGEPVTI